MQTPGAVVYVVSSNLSKRQELEDLFASYGIRVVSFHSPAAYSAKGHNDAACLVLGLNILDDSGLEFQMALTERHAPPVVFVADHADPVSCVRAVKNGAVDILIGPLEPADLMSSVQAAFVRDQQSRNETTERTALMSRWRTLTPREMEVFHHTVAGLLNKQAAAELGVAENTYQVHRGRVMRKMKADSLADLVRMSTKLEPILRQDAQAIPVISRPVMRHEDLFAPIPLRGRAFQTSLGTRFTGSPVMRHC